MKQILLAASCVAAVLAFPPLAAQTQPPGIAPPRPAVTPMPETVGTPPARTIDVPSDRPAGRVSETAPAPRAVSGETRFRADLATCRTLEAASQASCRREMYAARAQGLYRN
jgi:hypothetical protein